jgi:5-methyltetrahydrofolate--homocysteine methyltransferase
MPSLLETLHSGRVLLMDGAMGTELQRAGIGEGECYEAWNLTHPDKVRAIHQAYVDAGAEVLLTNTFQANPIALSKYGIDNQLESIFRRAIQLARSVAGPKRFVVADVGPFEHDNVSLDEARRIRACIREADAALLETCSDLGSLGAILKCRPLQPGAEDCPFLFSWTYLRTADGWIQTITRRSPKLAARKPYGHVALGVNCGRDIGMDEIIEIIRCYRKVTDLPLFARPNAGTPTRVGNHWVYPLTPEKMADHLPELLEAGVSMVGGCCGTTPEHIAAMRPIVDAWNKKRGFE